MPTVSSIKSDQCDQLRSVLVLSPCKPYQTLSLPPSFPIIDLWLTEVGDTLASASSAGFVARDGQKVIGLAVCAEQDWETRVLGHKAAVLKHLIVPASKHRPEVLDLLIQEVLRWARKRGVELLSCRTYSDDPPTVHALERQGFVLVDTVLDYVHDSRRDPLATIPSPELPPDCTIAPATVADREALLQVAANAFAGHFGRFHADPHLTGELATRVYHQWLLSSCDGYADCILVARVNGAIAGYSVWKKPSSLETQVGLRLGHYSIAAVHSDFAGRGLFSALTYAGMAALQGSVDWIEGPTHVNNYPVQRGYNRLHWRISGARHTLHRWLREPGGIRSAKDACSTRRELQGSAVSSF